MIFTHFNKEIMSSKLQRR